jgi:Tol biopolymer transport system component
MVKRGLILVVTLTVAAVTVVALISVLKINQPPALTVPHEGKYGIYTLDPATNKVTLIYSTANEIFTSALRPSYDGDKFVFAQKIDGTSDQNTEIFTIGTDGKNLRRLTNNAFWDLYPTWSPDDTQIAFLSNRTKDLDIYVMNADGTNQHLLYDSGSHDADIDWAGDTIAFTSRFKIWTIEDDGTNPTQVTDPANAGEWGTANLPIGDYDPRLSGDGTKIVFERLEDPNAPHGGYNIYTVNSDGTGESRLTNTGYAQGLATWSHSADKIIYNVAAIGNAGKYDVYMMNADGTNNRNITPDYFPASFLCYSPIFSKEDSQIFFVGQWQPQPQT